MPLSAEKSTTPLRSAEQRRDALAQANRVRAERAALKVALKRGALDVAPLLVSPPPCLATARVAELLAAVPRCGPVKVARLLENCRISRVKRLGGLTQRQRDELLAALRR